MSVQGLVEAIETEAEAEATALLDRADEEARVIVDAVRQRARERVAASRAAAERAARSEAAGRVNAVRLRFVGARADTLADWLEQVFTPADEEVAAIADRGDPERWARALRRLVDEAALLAGPRARSAVRADDAAAVREAVAASGVELEVVVEPGLPPGLLTRSADGRVEVDATLPTRRARAREELAGQVARLLGADDMPRAVGW